MKFMCLVLLDSDITSRMTDADWKALDHASLDYDEAMKQEGVYIMSQALHGIDAARTVRVRGGDAMVVDGPYVECREHVAGFILVEARDVDHAVEIAKGVPIAKIGAIEVRPALEVVRPDP